MAATAQLPSEEGKFMAKYFGTDGIRGVAGKDLDAALAFKAGKAAAAALIQMTETKRPRIMIARDTRISCDMLEAAISAGLCSAGADVSLLGVLPTPAAAYLTVEQGADMGIVISASHNPFDHNGIKIFGRNGYKLSDALEENIERLIDSDIEDRTGAEVGRISAEHGERTEEYVKFLISMADGRYGGRIAVDCANGAASETAAPLFAGLNAGYDVFHDAPDGVNINSRCGSTHIDALREIVKAGKYDIGFAFDGDADRCLAVDERGETVDGDMMLAVIAREMKASGKLKGGGMVGTVVSNSGMDKFARSNGLVFLRAPVGDKNVLDMMRETGCNIGGESSGHLIFSDDATTGDGQLTAIKFLNTMVSTGKRASELVKEIPRYPQVMPSYKLTGGPEERDSIMSNPGLLKEIERQQELLAGEGRILVRPSGTEPIIRVLVEAGTEALANEVADHLIEHIKAL